MGVPLPMVKELAWGPKTTKWPSWESNPGTRSLYHPAQTRPKERQRGEHGWEPGA